MRWAAPQFRSTPWCRFAYGANSGPVWRWRLLPELPTGQDRWLAAAAVADHFLVLAGGTNTRGFEYERRFIMLYKSKYQQPDWQAAPASTPASTLLRTSTVVVRWVTGGTRARGVPVHTKHLIDPGYTKPFPTSGVQTCLLWRWSGCRL